MRPYEVQQHGGGRGWWSMVARAMNEARRLEQNPNLGAFRVRAALE